MSQLHDNENAAERDTQAKLLRTLAPHSDGVEKVIPFENDDVPEFIRRLDEFHNESSTSNLITK